MHPERWLESLVRGDVRVIDERLETESVYSQVTAFSAADRAMIDVLTLTREGRLAVVELKADEDIHLPLQGLDYRGAGAVASRAGRVLEVWVFRRAGIVGGVSAAVFVCTCVAGASATDGILRYISPEIEWASVGIDKR